MQVKRDLMSPPATLQQPAVIARVNTRAHNHQEYDHMAPNNRCCCPPARRKRLYRVTTALDVCSGGVPPEYRLQKIRWCMNPLTVSQALRADVRFEAEDI
jgi:hypothetical protein